MAETVASGQALDTREFAGVDRIAQGGNGLIAGEAAPPGQHHPARGRLTGQWQVFDVGMWIALAPGADDLRLLGHAQAGYQRDPRLLQATRSNPRYVP